MPSLRYLCLLLLLAGAAPPSGAATYAVVCGISKYEHSPLLYADDDAAAFYNWLISKEGGSVPGDQVSVLLNEKATRRAILQALAQQFGKAGEDDTVIFFFSGHGTNLGTFVSYGTDGPGSSLAAQLSHDDVKQAFKDSKARIKLCFADACHAGQLLPPERKKPGALVFQSSNSAQFDTSVAILMSSRGNEVSTERHELEQGIFTYYLLRALRGRADADGDGLINISELFAYVSKNVVRHSEGQQHPVLTGRFPRQLNLVRYR